MAHFSHWPNFLQRTTCEASATTSIGGNTVKVGINDRNKRDAHHRQLKNKTIISPVIDHQMVSNFDLPRQTLFVLDIEETQGILTNLS